MGERGEIKLKFPAAGINRRFAYQDQAPYSAADALNVRVGDATEGRARGGSRPGLVKAYDFQLGEEGAREVRMLAEVQIAGFEDDQQQNWYDAFEGLTPANYWWRRTADEDYFNIVQSTGMLKSFARSSYTHADTVGAIRSGSLIDLTNENGYEVYADVVHGDMSGRSISLVVAADLLTDDNDDYRHNEALECFLFFTATSILGWVRHWHNTVAYTDHIFIPQVIGASHIGRFKVTVVPSNGDVLVSCTWNDTYNLITDETISSPPTGHWFGFSLTPVSETEFAAIGHVRLNYYKPNPLGTQTRTLLVASAGGNLYRENSRNELVLAATGLVDDRPLQAVQRLGKLYIANHDEGVARPKVYDPETDVMTNWLISVTVPYVEGQGPQGCNLISRFRDRIVLALGHQWYMSEHGNPDNWDYGASGVQRAVSGVTTEAGVLGEPITALIAHSDDYLLFGLLNSLWVLRGDPAVRGYIDNLSHTIGVLGAFSWCRGPSGETIFLSRNGLHVLGPGGNAYPVEISRKPLPRELVDIDLGEYLPILGFDLQNNGVHIHLTPQGASHPLHLWFDWETKGFWPAGYKNQHEPMMGIYHFGDVSWTRAYMLGGRDGYVRRHSFASADDDGESYDNRVLYGPLRLGLMDNQEGILTELRATLGRTSGDVNWAVLVGASAEEARYAEDFATGTWSAGTNPVARPRARGHTCYLRLEGAGAEAWSIESVSAIRVTSGRQKPL